MFKKLNLEKTYQYLLIILAFLMPISVFGANLIIVFICLIWLLSGDYKYKLSLVFTNKLLFASFIFFLLHVLGLLWTDDLSWGLHIVHKMWYFFLLLPVLYSIVKKYNVRFYLNSFLIAMSIVVSLSYLIWFEIIPPFYNATITNPTPFMNHISHNPVLAFTIYLVGNEVLFNKKISQFMRYILIFFLFAMIFNMFITGGRAGQVMFFAAISILTFQKFWAHKLKAILIISIVISSISFIAYEASPIFKSRVNSVFTDISKFENDKHSSVGLRIAYAINSWEIVKKNPLIGIGTGDFPSEIAKINNKSPDLGRPSTNPHNMYLLVLTQLGLIGLLSFMFIFYYQFKISLSSNNYFSRNVGVALPIMFLIIMLSDSYLLGHFTSLVFIFFSSFLYKDFDKN